MSDQCGGQWRALRHMPRTKPGRFTADVFGCDGCGVVAVHLTRRGLSRWYQQFDPGTSSEQAIGLALDAERKDNEQRQSVASA